MKQSYLSAGLSESEKKRDLPFSEVAERCTRHLVMRSDSREQEGCPRGPAKRLLAGPHDLRALRWPAPASAQVEGHLEAGTSWRRLERILLTAQQGQWLGGGGRAGGGEGIKESSISQ